MLAGKDSVDPEFRNSGIPDLLRSGIIPEFRSGFKSGINSFKLSGVFPPDIPFRPPQAAEFFLRCISPPQAAEIFFEVHFLPDFLMEAPKSAIPEFRI